LLGPPGTGKSHLAQAIGRAAIQQGYRVTYREATHCLRRSQRQPSTARAKNARGRSRGRPLLIIDDLGMRKLPHTAAEISWS